MRAKPLTFDRAKDLRRRMTLPEVVLWECLRKGRLKPLRFRRQHPMGAYILDFYCSLARLAVEIDGDGHGHPDQERHDRLRDGWLKSQGVRVLRFPASSVLDDEALSGVLAEIEVTANFPLRSGGSTGDVGDGGGPLHPFGVPLPRERGRIGSPSPEIGGGFRRLGAIGIGRKSS